MYKKILKKINDNNLKISIVGLGYVGLQLLIGFSKSKNTIYGIDIDIHKIKKLKKNKSYINYIKDDKIEKLRNKDISFHSDYSPIEKSDVIILCLPTPLKKNKPDLSFLKHACIEIKTKINPGSVLILESTSYPGTTEEFLYDTLNLQRFTLGKNFFLGFSPEREDPGNKKYSLEKIPKVISGYSKNCIQIIDKIYKIVVKKTVIANSIKVAETSKLLENIYRAVNVTLVNEIKLITNKLNIDIFDVINVAKTKPFGFKAFYPGPGLGGHCLPIDPLYLSYKAKQLGVRANFIELTNKINSKIPGNIINIINRKIGSKKKNILILGVTYKPNIDDIRESSGIKLLKLIIKKNLHKVSYSDPYVKSLYINNKKINSLSLNKNNMKIFDCVVLITDHEYFDYRMIEKESKVIVDTRGRFKISNKVLRG